MPDRASAQGPLTGLRVIEMQGLGPVPLASMVLADLGADVLRIDRRHEVEQADYNASEETNLVNRGRRSVALDLKSERDVRHFLSLVDRADVLLEGFRPGVMERLGIGPSACQERNAAIVYVRVTGWGQDGPFAHVAGHDLNYIALAGTLGLLAHRDEPPAPPLNVIGDYAAGSLFAVVGVLAALHERASSGCGQVVDTAILDGLNVLNSFVWGQQAAGLWRAPGDNFIDGGSPFYSTYATADGRSIALGAIEDKFFACFAGLACLPPHWTETRRDRETWPELQQQISTFFRSRSLAEHVELFGDTDACVTPVLTLDEASSHPQVRERESLIRAHGLLQPAPAPRFSRTPGAVQGASLPLVHRTAQDALKAWN